MTVIDTGTTNIAGPSSAIQAIYAQIPNSSPASGQWAGYYQYRTSLLHARTHNVYAHVLTHSMLNVGDS